MDLISRKAAIDAVEHITSSMSVCVNTVECHGMKRMQRQAVIELANLPPAQPERLTDDDFETIRIHLSAYKEKLCNQHRWKEAEEYQRIIDRFMSFASAQPEIIHCRECKHRDKDGECGQYDDGTVAVSCKVPDDHYCGYAERRTDAD